MSSTNKTEHYNLPQFVASDKPSWLTDENAAMQAIDAAMFANSQAAAQAATLAGTAKTAADNALSVADGAVDMAQDNSDSINLLGVKLLVLPTHPTIFSSTCDFNMVKFKTNNAYVVNRIGIGPDMPVVGTSMFYVGAFTDNYFELPTVSPKVGVSFQATILGDLLFNQQTYSGPLIAYYDGTHTFVLLNSPQAPNALQFGFAPLYRAAPITVTLTTLPTW